MKALVLTARSWDEKPGLSVLPLLSHALRPCASPPSASGPGSADCGACGVGQGMGSIRCIDYRIEWPGEWLLGLHTQYGRGCHAQRHTRPVRVQACVHAGDPTCNNVALAIDSHRISTLFLRSCRRVFCLSLVFLFLFLFGLGGHRTEHSTQQ